MAKSNYLIEGISGTGKSAVCEELQMRGYKAIEADDAYGYFGNPATGEIESGESQLNWIWDRVKLETELDDKTVDVIFICGGAMNQKQFESRFNKVFTLFLDDDTLKSRLLTRENNPFGKDPEDLARQLEWNQGAVSYAIQRGTSLIDASQDLTKVVDDILDTAITN